MLSDEDKARVGSGLIRCKKEKAPLHGAARLDSQEYIVITEDKDGAASSRLWDDPNFQAGLAEGKRLIAAKEKAERAKRLAEVLAVEAARKQLKREQRRIYTRGGGDFSA